MRYIYLLLITFIFASCGNQKMRFVRSNTEKQKVVEISDVPTIKKKAETTFNSDAKEEISEHEITIARHSEARSELDISSENPKSLNSENEANSFPETVQDSVTISAQEADDITDQALKAERDGTVSLIFGILIYVFLLLSLVALILSFPSSEFILLSVVFSILFVVSFILSTTFGIKSLRAKYNTPGGRKRAVVGLILAGIPLVYGLISLVFGLL